MQTLQMGSGMDLGPCTLGEIIGWGPHGAVFQALHATLARPVAVKIMVPPPLFSGRERAGFLAHFRQGSTRVAELHHPHILPILEYGEQDGLAYQILPYCPLGSLFEVVQRTGKLSEETVMHILEQVAQALTYAHGLGFIHGAITPSNLLMLDSNTMQLSDFGLATILPVADTRNARLDQAHLWRRFSYLSPEQLLGGNPDTRSDVYALGAVLFFLLTATPPYEGYTPREILTRQVQEASSTLKTARAALSNICAEVILHALAKLPEERFASVEEVVVAYRMALSSGSSSQVQHELSTDLLAHNVRNDELKKHQGGKETTPVPDLLTEVAPEEEVQNRSIFHLEDDNVLLSATSTIDMHRDELAENGPPPLSTRLHLAQLSPFDPVGASSSPIRPDPPVPGKRKKEIPFRFLAVCATALLLASLLLVVPRFTPGRDAKVQDPVLLTNTLGQSNLPMMGAPRSRFTGTSYEMTSSSSAPTMSFLLSAPSGPFTSTSISVQEIAGDNMQAATAFGLLFHCSSPDEREMYQACYSFEISAIGMYQVWKYDARTYEARMRGDQTCWTLLWQRSIGSEYHPGQGSINRLTVIDQIGRVTLQINGRNVGGVTNAALPSGVLGLIVAHLGTEAAFSHLVITRIENAKRGKVERI